MPPFLTADQILKSDTFRYAEMDVEEWGGTLRYKTISAADRDRWAASYARAQSSDDANLIVGAQARLIALAACDEKGARILTDAQVTELNEGQASDVIDRVFKAIQELNKIGEEALVQEGKDSSDGEPSADTSD